MPVVLRHNEALELNVVEYHGAVVPAELCALAQFLSVQRAYLAFDTLNVVMPDADFATVTLAGLDELHAHYRDLYAPLKFQIIRNAAWICLGPAARPHVRHWLDRDDLRESMSTNARQFETLTEAADWLMLSDAELALVERGEGFVEIARADIPAPHVRAPG